MNSRDVCLALLEAESEAEVQALIDRSSEMRNPSNWRSLDRRDTNFNVTGNQASDGGKALTELMTNMVDAVLLRHAREKGVDPKSEGVPATMYEAVDTFIKNLRGGRLVNLDPKDPWLKDFGQKNLVIGITGARSKREGLPCYTFVDNGEGQHPEDFETTFLSLSEGNKKDIPFVQGKFNMGSSGVLRYCGRRWFKLVVSRRFDGSGNWGWALMRRRPDKGNDMPVAEYFVLPDGTVPSFDSDVLYPFRTGAGKRYDDVHLKTGTVVKLYDYQVGARFMSFRGARDTLNENLVETILPFRLLDFRQVPKSAEAKKRALKRGGERAEGIDPRPFYGMEFLLLRSHREAGLEEEEDEAVGEEKVFVGRVVEPELGEITISAIPLKRELPGWLKQSNNRVFHSVNRQVQHKQSRGFLSQSCRLPALKDRIVILVDASKLKVSAHYEVWKGDRQNISNTIVGERYLELVAETIKDSQALRDLQNAIAQQELERAADSESNELFQQLVDSDPNLAALLSDRDPTIRLPSLGGDGGVESGSGTFEGSYSPTFIRLEEKIKEHGIDLPLNRTRPIAARTDVQNDYLNRPDNTGRLVLPEEMLEKFSIREHLHNGRLTIYVRPLEGKVDVGDAFIARVGLADDAIVEPVYSEEFSVRISDEIAGKENENNSSGKKHTAGDGSKKDGKGKDKPTRGLPKCVLLTRNGREIPGHTTEPWPEGIDFSELDGGLIEGLGEGNAVYKINYDNTYHIKYRNQQRNDVGKDVVTEKYILGMRILMLGYEHAWRASQTDENGENSIAEFSDEFRRTASRAAASTVLALAEKLPNIVDSTREDNDID